MSNSFTDEPTLVEPGRVSASQTIRTIEISRLADLQNHCFAYGGTHNVINQAYDDSCFVQDWTSFVSMSEWYIPIISQSHNELKIRLSAFCATTGSQVRFTLFFALSGNSYTDTINVSSTGRFTGTFDTATITITNTETERFAYLRLEAKAPASDEVEILAIQANWTPLTSPLSAGVHYIGTDEFIPQSANQQAADYPLSSRFGVQTINNIETLRTRGRVLLNWSGVSNASSTRTIDQAANPPIGIGHGDQNYLFSEVALFSGMNETTNLRVNLFANVVGLSGSQTITVEIFSHRLTFSLNGWNSYSLTLIRDEVARSNEFGLSMYRVGVEVSDINAQNLLSILNPVSSSPYISALSIIGV